MSTDALDIYFFLKPLQLRNAMNALHAFEPHPARTVELDLRVTVPASTPMLDVAQALTQLATAVNGSWKFSHPAGAAKGQFIVEGQP